jgi:hypothetical protein
MIRILIAGEGPNEIGHAPSNAQPQQAAYDGVIEAFLTKVRPGGWEIRAAVQWKDVRKLRSNASEDGEARTVRGLQLRARELGCNALVFLRDRDKNSERERSIRDVCETLGQSQSLQIAAGVPIEMLECWLLALKGDEGAHLESEPVTALHDRYTVTPKKTAAMVQHVRNSRLLGAALDASSLWRWVRSVAIALRVRIPREWPRP